jgi:hydrogenase maturation protease
MDFISVMEKLSREKTCFVGVGNSLMLDDGVGPYIVNEIIEHVSSDNITVLNAEDVPENYVFRIAESDSSNVIIIDAVLSDGEAGSVFFGPLNEFTEIINNFSTHKLSLFLSASVLEQYNKKVWLLGIKVRDTDFGTGLSESVKKSADTICGIIKNCINRDQKEPVHEHRYVH